MNQDQFWLACYKTITLINVAHPERVEARRDLQDPCRAEHLVWMLEMAVVHYTDGKPEKANRWLGYAQGVIAARGWATLDELKKANMPEGEQFDGDRV